MSQAQHNFPSLEAQMQSKEEMASEKARSNLIANVYKISEREISLWLMNKRAKFSVSSVALDPTA